jgi:hypothetical protein
MIIFNGRFKTLEYFLNGAFLIVVKLFAFFTFFFLVSSEQELISDYFQRGAEDLWLRSFNDLTSDILLGKRKTT